MALFLFPGSRVQPQIVGTLALFSSRAALTSPIRDVSLLATASIQGTAYVKPFRFYNYRPLKIKCKFSRPVTLGDYMLSVVQL